MPPAPGVTTPDLAAYGRELAAFHAEHGAAWYAAFSGRQPDLELAPIYERHASLFEPSAIDELRQAASAAGDEARQARALLTFAVEGHLQRRVVALTEAIGDAEARAIVVWRGDRLPYRRTAERVAEISDRRERNALESSYLEAVEAINPLRIERFEAMRAATAELGYAGEPELAAQLHGIDVGELAADLREFLAASETAYYAALRRYLAEIDIEQGDASSADLGYLLRGRGWDAWFPAARLLPVARATLAAIGIDLDTMRNVTLDLEPRPGKTPRAFVVPVKVPSDVRLVLQPRGGYDDYDGVLHELGHLLHFAHVGARLPVADRLLGDNSVTEGYAFLFEHLLHEPKWLAARLEMPDREIVRWLDFAAFRRLVYLRRYTAKLLYEIRLHEDGATAASRAYYAGLLGLLTGVSTPEEPFLADVDDHFYAARYLRAWMLEATLSTALRALHGDEWWTVAAAGETLRGLWARGQELAAQDVVAHLGYDRLDWRPLLRQIRTQLIGEMSGYGGPNITTRAGTRKV